METTPQLAHHLLSSLGGPANVQSITHCMTRIHAFVYNTDFVNWDSLTSSDEVMGVIEGQMIQIVVGSKMSKPLADELAAQSGLKTRTIASEARDTEKTFPANEQTGVKRFLKSIGNIFIPLMPALIASGLISGIANSAANAGVDPDTTWLAMFLLAGGAIFAFLGVLVGWCAAGEFGGTPAFGAIAGAIIIHPDLESFALYGENFIPDTGGILAIIFAAWVMAQVERLVRRMIPPAVDIIFTPVVTVLLVSGVTFTILHPAGALISHWTTQFIEQVLTIGGALAGAVLAGAFLPFIVVGMHHGLTPVHLEFIQTAGATPLLPILAMAGAGQVGAAGAIFIKTNHQKLRTTIKGALPVGVLGIGEPLAYGVTLPLGRPFFTACLGAACGGAVQAVLGTAATSIGVSGISLLPLIDDGMYVQFLTGLAAAYVFGFLFTYLFGFREAMADHLY
ncbi:PTS system IIB component (Glc family) /PTS system IIC component (Glc family) [Salsuginibacillus halophilus]|uniref:PTS system IIB component (Glc family) /PTS system IIC component (Glc family) n=1 Tax=Salsuginibacillus halophilus TaxID=517424 RepID=A0A2P8HQL0_9BACI|nr:PTS transporter subunit EIIC [Salsuginibacillus halophilus]PSL48495.1 PTS system IIB component (Glc family) /PTS system IIC component (Glc family) [Salsuginibacillus halophilus]